MRYVEFKSAIEKKLRKHPGGLTWSQLKERLDLFYERPCPSWVKQLEREIGLRRVKGAGRAYVWKVDRESLRD